MSSGEVTEEVDADKFDDTTDATSERQNIRTVQFSETEPGPEPDAIHQVLGDENISPNDDNNDDNDDYNAYDAIPWHHMQLYQLYGDDADYFLHPKISKTADKQMSTKPLKLLKNRCGDNSGKTIGNRGYLYHFS